MNDFEVVTVTVNDLAGSTKLVFSAGAPQALIAGIVSPADYCNSASRCVW